MKKKSAAGRAAKRDDLDIPETPPEFFRTATMGKYHADYSRGGKTVRAITLDDDVASVSKTPKP